MCVFVDGVEVEWLHPRRKCVVSSSDVCRPGCSGIVCILLVGFRWSVKLSLGEGLLEEDVSWPLDSEYIKCSHSHAADMIEVFYLMDVVHVVYKVISSPSPISLVSCLN